MKDVEPRSCGDEENEVSVADALSHPRQRFFGEAPEAQRSGAKTGHDVHVSREEARPGAAREIADQPLSDVLANPLDHVVVARAPVQTSLPVANPSQQVSDLARRSGQSQREHRLHVRDAIESGKLKGERLRLVRSPSKGIHNVGATAKEASDSPHPLPQRSDMPEPTQQSSHLCEPLARGALCGRRDPPFAPCAIQHRRRLYDIARTQARTFFRSRGWKLKKSRA